MSVRALRLVLGLSLFSTSIFIPNGLLHSLHLHDSPQPFLARDDLINQSEANKFQMNERKCKELQIVFNKLINQFEPIKIHNTPLEFVKSTKILGLTLSDYLKWNEHFLQIVKRLEKDCIV